MTTYISLTVGAQCVVGEWGITISKDLPVFVYKSLSGKVKKFSSSYLKKHESDSTIELLPSVELGDDSITIEIKVDNDGEHPIDVHDYETRLQARLGLRKDRTKPRADAPGSMHPEGRTQVHDDHVISSITPDTSQWQGGSDRRVEVLTIGSNGSLGEASPASGVVGSTEGANSPFALESPSCPSASLESVLIEECLEVQFVKVGGRDPKYVVILPSAGMEVAPGDNLSRQLRHREREIGSIRILKRGTVKKKTTK